LTNQTQLRKFECWEPQNGVRKEEEQGEFWLLRERFKRDGTGADFLMGCGCVCAIFVVLSLLVEAGINYLGRVSFPLVCVNLYRNFMVFCLQLMKQTKLDCWVGGGGLRIFLYLVAVAEKEKNEIPEPDFGEDKVWCVSRPLFLHLCLLKRLTQCCW
jgi:hypothetical protein